MSACFACQQAATIYAPKGTPASVVARLNGVVVKTIRSKEVNEKLTALGAVPVGDTPDELAAHTKASGTSAE